jgi:hypothetical protein
MARGPDERAEVDVTDAGDDPAKDAREEYTAYREVKPDAPDPDPAAVDEADLQPGEAESEEEGGADR